MSALSQHNPPIPHTRMSGQLALAMDGVNVRGRSINRIGTSQSINQISIPQYDEELETQWNGSQSSKTSAARCLFSKYKPSELQGVNESIERGWNCRLCDDTAEDPCVTRCGHLYCRTHLRQWLSRDSCCPVCNTHCTPADDMLPIFSRDGLPSTRTPLSSGFSTPSDQANYDTKATAPNSDYPSSGSPTPTLLRRPWNSVLGGDVKSYSRIESEETLFSQHASHVQISKHQPSDPPTIQPHPPHPLAVSQVVAHFLGIALRVVGLAILLAVLLR